MGLNRSGPIVIGLTGGLGSGKSAVLGLLKEAGVRTGDADEVVHDALQPGGSGYRLVLRLLGRSVRRPDGTLDRPGIARRVFKDLRLRRRLEAILHPLVRKEFARLKSRCRPGELLVLDVPLLFETGMDRDVDRTVVVWAPKALRLRRLAAGGRMTRAEARRRMAAQMDLREKARRADAVLDNSGTRADLARQVDRLFLAKGTTLF